MGWMYHGGFGEPRACSPKSGDKYLYAAKARDPCSWADLLFSLAINFLSAAETPISQIPSKKGYPEALRSSVQLSCAEVPRGTDAPIKGEARGSAPRFFLLASLMSPFAQRPSQDSASGRCIWAAGSSSAGKASGG